jgi:two-component system sensor histidine kinase/response regulator
MLPSLTDEETESASPSTVLVIDDDELSLRIIANALYETQYRVLTATNAADGIRLAKEDQPKLIIAKAGLSDTNAPAGTHSTKLIALLKECAPEASVIAMTDYGAEQLAAFALKQGAEDYLIHPVYPWEIVNAAGEVLERAELRRRNLQLAEALRQRKAELEQRNEELEDANARLREADIWKENLSNMIIHDLKNPLGVIQGTMIYFKGTLEDDLDDRQSQLLDSALISADRSLRLVSAILDVHRLEEGRMPLELKPVAVNQVIQICLDEVYPLLAMHALTATMHVPEALPPVCADYNTLVRIVGNLLDNAIKFTPSGGRITISARWVSDEIHFSVSDTGYGIPAEQRERIFEKFAQAGIRLEGKRAGVGLGLTFCKLAVEAHRGRIWAESTEGSGATFHFVLPIWVGEA